MINTDQIDIRTVRSDKIDLQPVAVWLLSALAVAVVWSYVMTFILSSVGFTAPVGVKIVGGGRVSYIWKTRAEYLATFSSPLVILSVLLFWVIRDYTHQDNRDSDEAEVVES